MESASKFSVLAVFAIVSLLFSVITVQGQFFTILPYTDELPPCYNGIKDDNETGVDCGGSCALTVGCVGNCTIAGIVDYCDGIDNDKDCIVDEDCKPNEGRKPVAAPKESPQAPGQAKPTCSDGVQNQGEIAVDCGGECVVSAAEVCDGVDNDRDCQLDEGGVCATTAPPENLQPISPTTTAPEPTAVPNPMPAPEPVSAPVPQSTVLPENSQSQLVAAIPAEQSPSTLPVEVGGEEQMKWLRQFAKNNSIYVPDAESDAELLKKYTAFTEKHEAELTAKFEGKSPTERDIADVIKQFSDETYPKPEPKPQAQGFFSKVKSFFKKLFS